MSLGVSWISSATRRFIPHISELAKPMIKLTEKDRPFQWNEEQQKAFQDLKEIPIQAPVHRIFRPRYGRQ